MAVARITKRVLDTTDIIPDKRYEIWDTDIKGLIVEVNPSGRKTFSFRFYDKNKKRQKIKIGIFGNITCEIAREVAQGIAGDLARGIDPREKKLQKTHEEKKMITFSQFFCFFTERYININHKQSTISRDKCRIKLHIIPFFGAIPLNKITVKDILIFKDSLQHAPGTFNKCYTLLHKAFSLAELWGYRENINPCRGVQKYPERKMERFLKKDELDKLEEVLKLEEIYRLKSPYVLAAIRMLIYTGCRMGEILTLKWEDIDLNDHCIHLKDSKTGKRTIPLNKSAKEVLHRIEKQKGNPFVFCGDKPRTHLINIQKAWQKIRKRAGISDVRIHDLRHSFASFMIKNGVNLFEVSRLLGHRDIKTTTRYLHLTNRELVEVANKGGEVFKAG